MATRLITDVKDWLEARGEVFTDSSEDLLFHELCDLIENATNLDGYALARELESRGWSPDEDLVAIFSDMSGLVELALREEVVSWVSNHGLMLKHCLGRRVKFKMNTDEYDLEGEIVELHPESLEYSIDMGHHALLVPLENVHA